MVRNRLTVLLDNRTTAPAENGADSVKGVENEEERSGVDITCSEDSGSDLCSVLLGLYDKSQSQGSEVLDGERSLVSAVLSSVLCLSHSAKHTALQGEGSTIKRLKRTIGKKYHPSKLEELNDVA